MDSTHVLSTYIVGITVPTPNEPESLCYFDHFEKREKIQANYSSSLGT